MPTFSQNTRRSASSVGLISNISYPAPDSVILDNNSDGSDLRHIAGIYRGENIINVEGGTTVTSSADFTIRLDSQFLNNLAKTINIGLSNELSSQFAQALTKTTTTQFSTDISSSFNNSATKTVKITAGLDLSSNFTGISTTVVTAPQISLSITQALSLSPSLLILLSSPKIFLGIDNNVQLLSNSTKTVASQLSSDLYSQLTPNLTKTTSLSLSTEQSSNFSFALTKTLVGLSIGTDLTTDFTVNKIRSGSVVFSNELSSQFALNLTKTTTLELSIDQGVFIGGTAKTTTINVSFATELCSQFKAVAPSILDNNPSTFCFTMYIMKELDFNQYITQTKNVNLILKNRC